MKHFDFHFKNNIKYYYDFTEILFLLKCNDYIIKEIIE